MAIVPAGFSGLGFSRDLAGRRAQQVENRAHNTIAATGLAAEVNTGMDAARAMQIAANTAEHEQRQAMFNNAAQQATSPDAYRAYMAKQACCLEHRARAAASQGMNTYAPGGSLHGLAKLISGAA